MSFSLSKILPLVAKSSISPTILAATQVSSVSKQSWSAMVQPSTLAQYGGRYTITMIPGDGIGPEMMGYVKEVFRYAGAPVDFQEIALDFKHTEEIDFKNCLTAIKRNGVALKGSIESQYGEHTDGISRNAALRTELDLFANVLHCKSYKGVETRMSDIDIMIIRQNTEGEYSMLEHETVDGVVESMKIITRSASERLARYAFNYALQNNRKRITCIHKANIMKLTDGLFLEVCTEVAKEFPEIEYDNMIVDNTCMQLASNPQQFDVMICPNLYGTVISNLICGLVGGAGLLSGINYGDEYAVFEPGTRNTGTALAGRNVANPIAMLNASCDLLKHLNLVKHENIIRRAIDKTINEDHIHTADLNGQATSIDVVQNIIKHVQADKSTQSWL